MVEIEIVIRHHPAREAEDTYRHWYEAVQRSTASRPQMRAFAEALTPPMLRGGFDRAEA